MKRTMLFVFTGLAILMLSGCATMKREKNIVADKEWIPCNDPDCSICGGTGEYTCTDCNGDKTETCRACNGSGEVDCKSNIAMRALGATCEGGYIKLNDPSKANQSSVDSQGFMLDSTTGEREVCPTCGGSGVVDCKTCDGSGEVNCSTCQGSGVLLHGEWDHFATCKNCGTRLEEGATNCSECGLNEFVFTCKECGAKFNEKQDVCPECGAGE